MDDVRKSKAWRDVFGMLPDHYVYTARHSRGGIDGGVWGRCRCGATLDNQSEIDAHLAREGKNDDAQPNP